MWGISSVYMQNGRHYENDISKYSIAQFTINLYTNSGFIHITKIFEIHKKSKIHYV